MHHEQLAEKLDKYRKSFGDSWVGFAKRLGLATTTLYRLMQESAETHDLSLKPIETVATKLSEVRSERVFPVLLFNGERLEDGLDEMANPEGLAHYIGKAWRTQREKRNLTRNKAAEVLEVPKPILTSYELGIRRPKVIPLVEISAAYDLTVKFLEEEPAYGVQEQMLVRAEEAIRELAKISDADLNVQAARRVTSQVQRILNANRSLSRKAAIAEAKQRGLTPPKIKPAYEPGPHNGRARIFYQ